MNQTGKKELAVILCALLVSALVFFIQYDHWSLNDVKIEISKLRSKPHNCYTTTSSTNKNGCFFSGGYAYKINEGKIYTGIKNIAMIPSSGSWHVPVWYGHTQLLCSESKSGKKYHLKFYCPDQSTIHQLPVVLLVTDPNGFFDAETGIYVQGNKKLMGTARGFYHKPWTEPANYFERGAEWKRDAYIIYYNEKGNSQYAAAITVMIAGNATRCFPQKSLRLDINKKKKRFELFGDGCTYSSVVLRNGGNDWTKTLISDGVMQEAVRSTGLDVLNFKPCQVYLNGVYWGIYSLRNRSNRKFIAERYQVELGQVTFMENWIFDKGDRSKFDALKKVIDRCGRSEKKDGLMQEIEKVIDLDQFALYLACQIFYANTDWPTNNVKAYCLSAEGKPDRWRFILCDLDYGLGYTGKHAVKKDMFDYLEKQKNPMAKLVKTLLEEESFRKKLRSAFDQLIANQLSAENLRRTITSYAALIEPDMSNHIKRWRKPLNLDQWKENVNALIYFSENRNKYLQSQIDQHLTAR